MCVPNVKSKVSTPDTMVDVFMPVNKLLATMLLAAMDPDTFTASLICMADESADDSSFTTMVLVAIFPAVKRLVAELKVKSTSPRRY